MYFGAPPRTNMNARKLGFSGLRLDFMVTRVRQKPPQADPKIMAEIMARRVDLSR
jgi:hypothetical protein